MAVQQVVEQRPVPGSQTVLHEGVEETDSQKPLTHAIPDGQACPQAPQLLAFEPRNTQVPPQSVRKLGQEHVPPWQVFPPVQTLPQKPQLL